MSRRGIEDLTLATACKYKCSNYAMPIKGKAMFCAYRSMDARSNTLQKDGKALLASFLVTNTITR